MKRNTQSNRLNQKRPDQTSDALSRELAEAANVLIDLYLWGRRQTGQAGLAALTNSQTDLRSDRAQVDAPQNPRYQ
jgi:hypothetical protein